MRHWVSTVFAWKYWAAFSLLCFVMAVYAVRLLLVLIFAACEAIGYLLLG
jgi:hypothetical protein